MVRKAEIKVVEGLRGGKGRLEMHHILKPEELNGHGRVYALIRMEPHSSIGFHEHILSLIHISEPTRLALISYAVL